MKYIVPLFRENTGRANLGLVNWDSFQAGFRMVMRGDKFTGVTWDPWWRERKSGDRRKRGNNVHSPSDGYMKRLGAAFILKARVSSHCAWFTKGARTGRNEMEVIGVNQRHARSSSALKFSFANLGTMRFRTRMRVY